MNRGSALYLAQRRLRKAATTETLYRARDLLRAKRVAIEFRVEGRLVFGVVHDNCFTRVSSVMLMYHPETDSIEFSCSSCYPAVCEHVAAVSTAWCYPGKESRIPAAPMPRDPRELKESEEGSRFDVSAALEQTALATRGSESEADLVQVQAMFDAASELFTNYASAETVGHVPQLTSQALRVAAEIIDRYSDLELRAPTLFRDIARNATRWVELRDDCLLDMRLAPNVLAAHLVDGIRADPTGIAANQLTAFPGGLPQDVIELLRTSVLLQRHAIVDDLGTGDPGPDDMDRIDRLHQLATGLMCVTGELDDLLAGTFPYYPEDRYFAAQQCLRAGQPLLALHWSGFDDSAQVDGPTDASEDLYYFVLALLELGRRDEAEELATRVAWPRVGDRFFWIAFSLKEVGEARRWAHELAVEHLEHDEIRELEAFLHLPRPVREVAFADETPNALISHANMLGDSVWAGKLLIRAAADATDWPIRPRLLAVERGARLVGGSGSRRIEAEIALGVLRAPDELAEKGLALLHEISPPDRDKSAKTNL